MCTFCTSWCRLLIAMFLFFYSCVSCFFYTFLGVEVANSSLHYFILVFLCSFSLVRTSHNGWCQLFFALFDYACFFFFLVHLHDKFFLYLFYFPLVLGHHGISHIAIVYVSFIAPIVCTYFCPFFFPLLAFPLCFQVSFVFLKISLFFHVCKCFFLCFCFVFVLHVFLCRFLYLWFWISSFIFKQCNVIFFFFYFFSPLLCLFFYFYYIVMFTIDEASRKKLCSEGSIEKKFLKFWKRSYFHLLLYLMNSLTYILMVSVVLHLLLHHLWLLMSLMNCCGPLMEMTFMWSALNFIHVMLPFLLINVLLIPFSCILVLISFLFILLYCILKQFVILVGIFFHLTLVYI